MPQIQSLLEPLRLPLRFLESSNLDSIKERAIKQSIHVLKYDHYLDISIVLFSLLVLSFISSDSAFAYVPGTAEEEWRARQLNFAMIIKKLGSGGFNGNIGSTFLIFFSLLAPTVISLQFAIRKRYYLLKILQYPALIWVFLGIFVLIFQPTRWLSGDWAAEMVWFGFSVGLVFSSFSIYLLLRVARPLGVLISMSTLIGLILFVIRSLLPSI